MEAGFTIDRGDLDVQREAMWASGDPKRSIWAMSAAGNDARKFAMTTYRCERCGYLESYATEPMTKKWGMDVPPPQKQG
ncbi:MAG TPA: hypothetical protein VNE58_14475 [Casimicrobiaceae bacterium]|nr:hypothetical protein [Casimicrobiaceae bacterium]